MLRRNQRQPSSITGSAFGAGLLLSADTRDGESLLRECLPPQWLDGPAPDGALAVELATVGRNQFEVRRGGMVAATGSRDEVIGALDWILRGHVATTAPEHIFIHAGTVAYRGRAVLIPGQSFSGKTTLVGELVLAGAEYYSDEYAVIDLKGLIHPYPKPLSIRNRDIPALRTDTTPAELGAMTGTDPVPLGLVVSTQYRPRTNWDPDVMTKGETLLALMSHTYSALDRPEKTMQLLRLAVEDAIGLSGDRGEAEAVVPDLLSRLES